MRIRKYHDTVKKQFFEELNRYQTLECPTCERRAHKDERSIHKGMALTLIWMWRTHGFDWVHLPSQAPNLRSREEGKLVHWGLLEPDAGRREDGGRTGTYRVTEAGRDFVLGRHKVPKYVRVWKKTPESFYGPDWSISDALGEKFDLNKLLYGDVNWDDLDD